MKPRPLVNLKKGELIDSQRGFVDSFNYIQSVAANFKGDDVFVKVDRSNEDVPVISLTDKLVRMAGKIDELNETTLKGNTTDSTKIGPGDLNFKSGEYSNVEVRTDGTDIVISCFYL